MARYKTLNTLEPDELVEVMGFIDLLKDSEKYRAQVEELESRKQEINDLINVLGDVSEVENLRSAAYARNAEATRFRDEAAKIKVDAEEFVRKKRKDAIDDAAETVSRARADFSVREETLQKGEKSVARREAEDFKRDRETVSRERAAEKLFASATETEKKYTVAIGQLKKSIDEIAKAL
jgi:hypothetical protein